MEAPPTDASAAAAVQPCWSNVVKAQLGPPPHQHLNTDAAAAAAQVLVKSCKSREGISVAVIDANAVIDGGDKLNHLADKFVTVPEVLDEIRDPVSRHRLAFVPFTIESMEPSPESLNKVVKFARATGDLQTLSDVDLKLIALTYTLESQVHGTNHLRDAPPPIQTVNVRRLPEKEMPGWGLNVPNLEEWEALEREGEEVSNSTSRILPLKDISLNIPSTDQQSEDGETSEKIESDNFEDGKHELRRPRRYAPQKKEVNIEGKKNVADGVDASQGKYGDDAGDWMPAVSRSTHRRFLRRKARREYYEALSERETQQDLENSVDNDESSGTGLVHQTSETPVDFENEITNGSETTKVNNGDSDLSAILTQMRLEEDSFKSLPEEKKENTASADLDLTYYPIVEPSSDHSVNKDVDSGGFNISSAELDNFEISSQTNDNESISESYVDDVGSEQSWMIRSLSESSVACVTSDFAMQNVLLQMGLRLLAPGGNQIRQLHRWILKCHACYTVTAEIGRIFCPKCGNGGTLRQVAVTVGENGIIMAARRPRITLRGTKFSLPLPQGGRDAISKNPILREDQLPKRFLNPKTKKKANRQEDDFFTPDHIFTHHTDKRAPFQPPVRKALSVFSGRRNPNDNHYSRPKH